ncbi:MAG: GntR family transcriptional regulator [Eggerthellaceae bacterium]|nr:GntR family transcriptional regulator [Eggerthellaceae bacterium]
MVDKPIPKFELTDETDLPLWVQIRDRFVFLISSGYYAPGDQLPSVRKVASELRISYNTVSKAFMSLEREGRIVTRHGSGAYVSEAHTAELSEVDYLTEEFVRTCWGKGLDADEIIQVVTRTMRRLEDGE